MAGLGSLVLSLALAVVMAIVAAGRADRALMSRQELELESAMEPVIIVEARV